MGTWRARTKMNKLKQIAKDYNTTVEWLLYGEGEKYERSQWIKLKVGMFDDSKIKYIEALPKEIPSSQFGLSY